MQPSKTQFTSDYDHDNLNRFTNDTLNDITSIVTQVSRSNNQTRINSAYSHQRYISKRVKPNQLKFNDINMKSEYTKDHMMFKQQAPMHRAAQSFFKKNPNKGGWMADNKESIKSRTANDYFGSMHGSINQTLNTASKHEQSLRPPSFSQTPKRAHRNLGNSE